MESAATKAQGDTQEVEACRVKLNLAHHGGQGEDLVREHRENLAHVVSDGDGRGVDERGAPQLGARRQKGAATEESTSK